MKDAVPQLKGLEGEMDDQGMPHLIGRFEDWRAHDARQNESPLDDPKEALVEWARASPHEGLRNDIVPNDPTVNDEGRAYTTRMQRFVRDWWKCSWEAPVSV